MPEVQKGQEQLVFLTFLLYRYNLSFYYNQVQFVPVFIIEKSRKRTGTFSYLMYFRACARIFLSLS